MSSRLNVEALLERNKSQGKTFPAKPSLSEAKAAGFPVPTIIVITCCDVRVHPIEFLNLEPTEVFLLRNVGGRVGPLVNDIVTLDGFLGITEVMVIHHTDCGATWYSDQQIRDVVNARAPGTVDEETTFGAIDDLEQSVRGDVNILKTSPLLRKDLGEHAKGFVFDIKTGLLRAVE